MSAISSYSETGGSIKRYPCSLHRAGGPQERAELVYATWGTLNDARDNVILLPSYYTGSHAQYARLIGQGRALDPRRHFIIGTNHFGNGVSTSPSHWEDPDAFPRLTIEDNVRAQRALLADLGIQRIALVTGWSLGAMQSLHWAMLYPDMVDQVVAICGTAFCWPANAAFLASIAPILEAVPHVDEQLALDLFGRAYAPWAYSAEFFRSELYRTLGFVDVPAFFNDWGRDHQAHRAADLLAVLRTWAGTACTPNLARVALSRIKARCFLLPCDTDQYFTVADAMFEASAIANASLSPLHSPFGHCAGAPGRFNLETEQIESHIREALAYDSA